jgi:hypothetical protein
MRRSFVIFFVLVVVASVALMGCESMGENTKRGAVGGGLLGAIAGGVIGHQSGHGIEGAAIGAGAGALGGGLIGDSIDSKKTTTVVTGEKLGISDVIALSKSGLSEGAIITKISETGSVYNLSVEEIELLRKEGVSAAVINFMMSTKRQE